MKKLVPTCVFIGSYLRFHWFLLAFSLVPTWFSVVPTCVFIGSYLVFIGSYLRFHWFLLAFSLVPTWFALVPTCVFIGSYSRFHLILLGFHWFLLAFSLVLTYVFNQNVPPPNHSPNHPLKAKRGPQPGWEPRFVGGGSGGHVLLGQPFPQQNVPPDTPPNKTRPRPLNTKSNQE
jgi:hypothetical protein